MKKISMLVGMAIFMSAGFTNAADTSATLNVSGTVTGYSPAANCGVVPSLSSIVISGTKIADQGAAPGEMSHVTLTVTNPNDVKGCAEDIDNGHIALKLKGQADNGQGTSLANTETVNAASGVAIGLYQYDTKQIIAVNDGILDLNKDTSSAELGLQMVKLAGQTVTNGDVNGALTVEIIRL